MRIRRTTHQPWVTGGPSDHCVCVCLPVDSSGRLVPWVICDPDMTLMELHSDWLIVPVIEQDTIFLCC